MFWKWDSRERMLQRCWDTTLQYFVGQPQPQHCWIPCAHDAPCPHSQGAIESHFQTTVMRISLLPLIQREPGRGEPPKFQLSSTAGWAIVHTLPAFWRRKSHLHATATASSHRPHSGQRSTCSQLTGEGKPFAFHSRWPTQPMALNPEGVHREGARSHLHVIIIDNSYNPPQIIEWANGEKPVYYHREFYDCPSPNPRIQILKQQRGSQLRATAGRNPYNLQQGKRKGKKFWWENLNSSSKLNT